MLSTFFPDQVDAHRLLVQVGIGRATASYKNNQTIFRQGEDANFVYFIQDGRINLTATSDHGLDDVLGIAEQGQFFGEACLHDVPVRIATATAIGDCRITSVTKEVMISAIKSDHKFAKKFIDYLSEQNKWVQKDRLYHLLESAEAA